MKVTVIIEETGTGAEVITRGGLGGVSGSQASGESGALSGSLTESTGAYDGGPAPGGTMGAMSEGAAPMPFTAAAAGDPGVAPSSSGDIAAGPAPGTSATIETSSEPYERGESEAEEPTRAPRARTRAQKGRARRG